MTAHSKAIVQHSARAESLPGHAKLSLNKTRGAGFTLIELLVVLAIVATLASLVAPRYFQQSERAQEVVLRDNLHSMREVLDKFYGDTGSYPETLEELVEKNYLRALPMDPITGSNSTWQLIGVPDGYKGAIYDIKSGASGQAKDGTAYADW